MTVRAHIRPLAILLLMTQTLWAVPHLHPELYPNAKPCHAKHITPEMIKKYGTLRAAIISIPTGTKNIAVIIVHFPNAGSSTSGSNLISSLANFNTYFASMKNYYNEVSFGAISLSV